MVKHIVFWNFTDDARDAGIPQLAEDIRSRFAALSGKIDGLVHIEFALNYTKGGHDAALYCEFESRQAEAAYQVNPLHVAIKAFTKPYFCQRAAVDYEL